jgi:hypothetical protein
MTCWASSETFVGSAGILPAAAGGLFFMSRRCNPDSFSALPQTVRQNAGHGGQHARAPLYLLTIQRFNDLTVHHAHRSHI